MTKLAVSNIAWNGTEDEAALDLLVEEGIRAIEIAPTRIWPNWEGMDGQSIRALRQRMTSRGLSISSLQSILFQKPDLRLFGGASELTGLTEHLRLCANLAAELGAGCLVFGAPRNRDVGTLSQSDAFERAVEFFTSVAPYFAERNTWLGFEANPADYNCNFATDAQTALRLVRAVNSPGFRLHLDTACMLLAGDDAVAMIAQADGVLSHVHASEPNLGPFGTPQARHQEVSAALRSAGYQGYVALEMRATEPVLQTVRVAVRFFRDVYDGAS